MKKVKIPTLRTCLQAKKSEIITYLEKICTKKGDKFWYKKSKVNNAVTLVCHVDTSIKDVEQVWNYKDNKYENVSIRKRVFFDRQYQVFTGPDGLGGDDRAGVFGILRVYASLPAELKPNLLFCDEEETGGHGARDAARLLPELKDSLMMIELDRRGVKDCVFYNSEPKEFVDYIESFGFKKDIGSFSDVSTLGSAFNICSTNLSVGFFNEHTRHETLYCKPLNATIEKTIKIVENATKAGKQWVLPKVETKKYTYDDDLDRGGYWGRRGRRCQNALPFGGRTRKYTEEELSRYPYLKELQEWEREGFQVYNH